MNDSVSKKLIISFTNIFEYLDSSILRELSVGLVYDIMVKIFIPFLLNEINFILCNFDMIDFDDIIRNGLLTNRNLFNYQTL